MTRFSFCIALSLMGLLIAADEAQAYKTQTHEQVSLRALELSEKYAKVSIAFGFPVNSSKFLVGLGSIHEDKPLRFTRHFYDPINRIGLPFRDHALAWGYERDGNNFSWVSARETFFVSLTGRNFDGNLKAETKTERIFYSRLMLRSMGHVIHLVEDMAQPSHVRNDSHASHGEDPTGVLPFLLNPSHLEDWTLANSGAVLNIINNAGGPRPVSSFEQPFLQLASFSNRNFFSDNTIFKDYPQPAKDDTNFTEDFIPWGVGQVALVEAEDGKIGEVSYIVKTRGAHSGVKLAQVGYFGVHLTEDPALQLLAFQIDDEVARENAEILIPLAVEYSAGLLDYFFRGDIDAEADGEAGKIKILNNSNESMSGTFALYYDDVEGNRKPVEGGSWVRSVAAGGEVDSLEFSAPSDAVNPGKYVLVFQGQMGNEDGAVVGKLISLETNPHVFIIQEFINGNPIGPVETNSDYSTYNRSVLEKSRFWDMDEQTASGRFKPYGVIDRISISGAKKLYINGHLMNSTTWLPGDTPGDPVTWHVENISKNTLTPVNISVQMSSGILVVQGLLKFVKSPTALGWVGGERINFDAQEFAYKHGSWCEYCPSKNIWCNYECGHISSGRSTIFAIINYAPLWIVDLNKNQFILYSPGFSFPENEVPGHGWLPIPQRFMLIHNDANVPPPFFGTRENFSDLPLPELNPLDGQYEIERFYSDEEMEYLSSVGVPPEEFFVILEP